MYAVEAEGAVTTACDTVSVNDREGLNSHLFEVSLIWKASEGKRRQVRLQSKDCGRALSPNAVTYKTLLRRVQWSQTFRKHFQA